MSAQTTAPKAYAVRFVVLIGIVSLFADMTYEGARSITGPYLSLLGASATVVGFVAGFGELVGYALRFGSGFIADRTKRYWAITFTGYVLNLLAVPLLALAGSWPLAAALMILERTGKAIRTPARDAMLSHATKQMGHGWGFGLHEALDQTGATIGPLIVAAVLYERDNNYPTGFAVLLVPAILSLLTLVIARRQYPRPQLLEPMTPSLRPRGFDRGYWLYVGAAGLVALGYADYPLIAYHFEKAATVPDVWIAIFYALAMASAGLSSLLFGSWFDRRGLSVLIVATLTSLLFAPFVFMGAFWLALIGAVLWGVGIGAHESVMKSAVAAMTSPDRRATAFGLFDMIFGLLWFAGSFLMGALYDASITALIAFSVIAQVLAIPLFLASSGVARGRAGEMHKGTS